MKIKKDDILKVVKGKVILGGEEITPGEVKSLLGEIQSWKQFRLRDIFYNSLRQYAIEEGLEESIKWETTLHFKGMLDTLGRMEKIEDDIEKLAKVEIKKPETLISHNHLKL